MGNVNVTGNLKVEGTSELSGKTEIRGAGLTSSNYGFVVTDSDGISNMWVRDDGGGYLRAAAWSYGSDLIFTHNFYLDLINK